MRTLLNQAITFNLMTSLDIQFASMIAKKNEPDILLAAAYLSSYTRAGHVCLMLEQLQVSQLFSGQKPELAKAVWIASGKLDVLCWNKRLMQCSAVSDGSSPTPLVLQNECLYLHRMWKNESNVIEFIKTNHPYQLADKSRIRSTLNQLFSSPSYKINWQKIAVAVALTRRISIISGAPGTGKTTIVGKLLLALLQLNNNNKFRIQLSAPTGKSAARLTTSLQSMCDQLMLTKKQKALFPTQAITLHRLLGAKFNTRNMRYNQNNPLHLDVLVVDEASMIDLSMMNYLIQALQKWTKVIFLGDSHQLSSLESGAVFSDLCSFSTEGYSKIRTKELNYLTGYLLKNKKKQSTSMISNSICMLRKNYRFNVKSGISQLSKAINVSDIKKVKKIIDSNLNDVTYYFFKTELEYQLLLKTHLMGYYNYFKNVHSKFDIITLFSSFRRFQILCALREGPFGTFHVNQQIEFLLQHAGLIHYSSRQWYSGKPIMITRNDSFLELFNGDIGITLLDEKKDFRVNFLLPNGSIKSIHTNRLPMHETAYAITVHKSQGSEFDHVTLILPNYSLPILTRELIYTAITRARYYLSLYINKKIFIQSICTFMHRNSGLIKRLKMLKYKK
ncbi:RecBCD enzyme subunit RecD [Candidatus Ecksteinia adelgidicola]|nr:RecBCD enzyme subunit RecD [Candidatus Ecksteinia adelgidicola]